MTKSIKMYWWNRNSNFGDALNPLFLDRLYGIRVTREADPLKAQLIGIGSMWKGSVIDQQDEIAKRGLHVWGTGFYGGNQINNSPYLFPHLVRGHVTAARFTNFTGKMGDAGLLSGLLLNNPTSKKYSLGIIPHWKEQGHPTVHTIAQNVPRSKIINVMKPPMDVIRTISECDYVISASLHGLVVADSLGVPNHWISLSDVSTEQGIKFCDYYSVFGTAEPKPIKASADFTLKDTHAHRHSYKRPNIDNIKQDVLQSFPQELRVKAA